MSPIRHHLFPWVHTTGGRVGLILLLSSVLLSTNDNQFFRYSHALDQREAAWVDSVFNQLSDEARFGQLFMLRAHSDKDSLYEQQVDSLIRRYHPGGLCFFQGTPEKQAVLTNRYQASSDSLPLLIAMDAEWGLNMRLKEGTIAFPKQLMLGAIQDDRLIYEFGREMARQCRRLGVQVSFSPDADVNNNADNPVINERSFGEDRHNVADKSFQYMSGLQDGRVLACAKHFPGHGDTNTDSHYDLPVIAHPRDRLDSLELFPFRVLSQRGIGSVMVAHLQVPTFDSRPHRPTTLSEATIQGVLRKDIGFEGLIFTDAMEMQAVTKYFGPGEADVEALRAGNDMVLLPANMGAAMQAIRVALDSGQLDRGQLYASVKRVLRAKYRLGLTRPQRVELPNLRRDLNTPDALLLKRRLIENALVLVRDQPGWVGFPDLAASRMASLALGDTNRTAFQLACDRYASVTHFNAGKELDSAGTARLLDTLRNFDVVLVSIHGTRSRATDRFGLTNSQEQLIRRLNGVTTVALTMFGNPYSLRYFDACPILLEAFTEDPLVQQCAAQVLFGAADVRGKLPVTASPAAVFGQGIVKVYPEKRLGYTLPEAVGLNSDTLALMDTIIRNMIATGAAPGCQVLVAKDNQVVWHKAYGYHTYEPVTPVTLDNLYDLASVTKVSATVISLMKLVDNGLINTDSAMSRYVPELRATGKRDLKVVDILIHQAGLQPWIPFYQKTLLNGWPSLNIYHPAPDADFQIPVAAQLYMQNAWVDTIWQNIFQSPLRADRAYKYSDLGLYLTARAISNTTGQRLDEFAGQNFYQPLGLATTTFNPWQRGWAARCVPTEEDGYFRHQRLQGYVHDMGAAMLGGVSGHAGLFSNANDLAKIFQMLLNGGHYAGRLYLQPATVKRFTTRYPTSTRRGIGFDMMETDPKATQNMSPLAGRRTFGHTGFTGICAWADPDKNLIFIFLSNRTYPTMENNKLINGDFRPRLQSVVYRALRR